MDRGPFFTVENPVRPRHIKQHKEHVLDERRRKKIEWCRSTGSFNSERRRRVQLKQRSEEGLNLVLCLISDMLRVRGAVRLTTRETSKDSNSDLIWREN